MQLKVEKVNYFETIYFYKHVSYFVTWEVEKINCRCVNLTYTETFDF